MVWKDYLYFSRPERNGIKILSAMLIVILTVPAIVDVFRVRPEYDFSHTAEIAAALDAALSLSRSAQHSAATAARPAGTTGTSSSIALSPTRFNPNTLLADEWTKMGFPERLGRAVHNYIQAGGSFRFREDLQRIYIMEDNWYEQIEAYIDLPSRSSTRATQSTGSQPAGNYEASQTTQRETDLQNESRTDADNVRPGEKNNITAMNETYYPVPVLPLIDINRADTTALTKIRGIGSVFSRRIGGYRNLLGGFHHPGQLLEVYGMDSTRWEQLIMQIDIDTSAIRKIDIHQADFSTYIRHPYIDRNLANALTNFVKQHGPLDSLSQIKQLTLITDSLYTRIAPYLSCE